MAKTERVQKRSLNYPALMVYDNIVFSKKEAWAYYKINTVPYAFLSERAKVDLADNTMSSLASLMNKSKKELDCHIIMTNLPFNVSSWEEQVRQIHNKWVDDSNKKTFNKFMDSQVNMLLQGGYVKRVTYLGIKLFDRFTFDKESIDITSGIKAIVGGLIKQLKALTNTNAIEISPENVSRAIAVEKEFYSVLNVSDTLKPNRPTSEELLLLMKRQLHPSMPTPYLESDYERRIGLNDIIVETGGEIENHPKYLKIKQIIDGEEFEGYRATLSFAKFNDEKMQFPNQAPFLYHATVLAASVYNVNSRFKLLPVDYIKKVKSNRELEIEDEKSNSSKYSARMAEKERAIRELDALTEQSSNPWYQGSSRITVEAYTYEHLLEAIEEIKMQYRNMDMVLAHTAGDQLEFLMEEVPGGTKLIKSFDQTMNLEFVGTSGFNFGGGVGDPVKDKISTTRNKEVS